MLLPVRAPWTADFVYGWVVRLVKLIRMTAMLFATGAAAVAASRLVVVTEAVEAPTARVHGLHGRRSRPAVGRRVTRKLRPGREESTRNAFPARAPVTVTVAPP